MNTNVISILLFASIVGVLFLMFLISRPSRNQKRTAHFIEEERRRQQIEADHQQMEEAEPVPAPVPTVSFPSTLEGKNRAYFYPDVAIQPVPGGADLVVVGEPLTFSCSFDSVQVFQGASCIGQMVENRLAGMVRDWEKAGDPVLGLVMEYRDDGSSAIIGLAFYLDLLAKFREKNPDAKPYRLAGKPEDLAFGYVPGSRCFVESDLDDPAKYHVMFEGASIGRLPAAVLRYAEAEGYDPEDLNVIVASVDYDVEKDRDIITVYVE